MGIKYTLCEHLQSLCIFPNPLCRIVCNSYDILMVKIKADPSEAWFCWAQLFTFWSQFIEKAEGVTWAFSVLRHSWKSRHGLLQSIVNLETCHSAEKRLMGGLTLLLLGGRWMYGSGHWPVEWQALVLCEPFQRLALRHCLFKHVM